MIPFFSIDRWGKNIKSKLEFDRIASLNWPKERENSVWCTIGNISYQAINKKCIIVGIERCKKTPTMVRNFLKDLNEFFNWVIIYEHCVISLNEGTLSWKNNIIIKNGEWSKIKSLHSFTSYKKLQVINIDKILNTQRDYYLLFMRNF